MRAIPVPDKTATTAANALFHDILFVLGFPSVLQSDRDGEWFNALLDCLTKLLSIKQVFTSSFCPRLNGATERVHRFLNAAIGICCAHFQEQWEEFLQPAVYSHNVSPISGVGDISQFFWSSVEMFRLLKQLLLDLPPHPLPQDLYAKHLVSRMKEAFISFNAIKLDLRRQQRDLYNSQARTLHIPVIKLSTSENITIHLHKQV